MAKDNQMVLSSEYSPSISSFSQILFITIGSVFLSLLGGAAVFNLLVLTWRTPQASAGVLGLLCAALFALTVDERRRKS